MSNASMVEWGSHATTSSTIHVPHEVFMVLHPTNARRRNMKHCQSNWSPSPLEQFRGGPTHSLYKQGITCRTINIKHRKIKEEGGRKENNNAFKFGLIFPFPSLYFQLSCKFIYV
jgi:hypothetical protein